MLREGKLLKRFTDEILYGAHLIAFSNALIVLIALVLLNNYDDLAKLFAIAYFVILIIYRFNHLREMTKDISSNPERHGYLSERIETYRFTIILSFLALVVLLSFTNTKTMIFVAILLVMDLLYPKQLTKKIVAFKDLYVAFFWSLIVFLPIFYYSIKIEFGFILFFIFVFLRSLLNITFYDLKDADEDRSGNLKTLPAMFGEAKTLIILTYLNYISLVPLLLAIYFKLLPFYAVSLVAVVLYSQYYISQAKRLERSNLRLLSYTLVDGEAVFWLLVLILGKFLIN